jgi:hypothetical protein
MSDYIDLKKNGNIFSKFGAELGVKEWGEDDQRF